MQKEKTSFSTVIDALTSAIKKSNVKVVYNYPGRPASLLIDNIKKVLSDVDVQDYLPNEFVATSKGFGSSVAGSERALVVFKDVGTNLACDLIHCLNHVGVNRGLVFFVTDDPSAWYSQNEEDSRGIYFNAGLPIFEPYDAESAYYSLLIAYELSEIVRLPVFIRTTTRAMRENYNSNLNNIQIPFAKDFVDIPFDAKDKWKSIFGTVERQLEELLIKQKILQEQYEGLNINCVIGKGSFGVIASGFPGTQLENERLVLGVSLLKLCTVFPLPEKTIINFIKDKERVLVIDQGEPLLERLVRDCAQRNGHNKLILGKLNGYVRKIGEFRDDDLKISVKALKENKHPGSFPKHEQIAKAPAFEKNDDFKIMLECLREAVKKVGCRPLYAADAGQACRIPDSPGVEDLLHMETTMGSSVSFLSGGIEAYKRRGEDIPFKGIAYVGDSSFFHNAFSSICEAVAKDHPVLMLLVDNQGSVSTGGQPHIGMKINNSKQSVKELSIKKILQALEISFLEEANVNDRNDLIEKIVRGLKYDRFAVVIVRY